MQNKPPTDVTIGWGAPGAKSAKLREFKPLIDKLRGPEPIIRYEPHVSITPLYFSGFLQRAGATHENTDSAKAISKTPFTREEEGVFRESMELLFNRDTIAVRSDECTANGVGLWHTGFMNTYGYESTTAKFGEIVKRILASEFSRDVEAFKKRTGLLMEETPGVLVSRLVANEVGFREEYMTVLHMNLITGFHRNDSLVSIGHGIGGGNGKMAETLLAGTEGYEFHEILRRLRGFNLLDSKVVLNGEVKKKSPKDLKDVIAFFEQLSDGYVGKLQNLGRAIRDLFPEPQTPSKYIELAFDCDSWVLVQIADIELGSVKRPDVPKRDIVIEVSPHKKGYASFGSNISGRKVVEAENVVLLDNSIDSLKLSDMNRELEGYVLVVKIHKVTFPERFSFADYSNAGAIVFLDDNNALYSVGSHLGGALREAGIPVLIKERTADDEEFLWGLNSGVNARKLLVYANDELEEGFVALRD